ncbi:hypothetical protein [uncultured Bacteroides sp.]|uniref:hypothetical protein n=1 Tax=uncultured Bacteroides sp. TaxID=162156 RepID=UPI0027DC2F38|nr:hypothetical protein [uncultured Bacteroides sp.]
MIRPKHYQYYNLSQPAQRKRTTLTTSGNRSLLKEYTSLTSSGMFLKSAADASLNTMQPFTMR